MWLAVSIGVALLASTSCQAEILALKCSFSNLEPVYFTRYTGGAPARIGIGPGIGSKAAFFEDRFGAQIFVETNIDGSPITFTTIQRDMKAFHSRHVLLPDGTVLAPSQGAGQCDPVDIR